MLKKSVNSFWFVLLYGWASFPASSFIFTTEQIWKNYFYLTVLLPWLLLLPSNIKKTAIWKQPVFIASTLLIIYLAVTTLWSDSSKSYFLFYFKQSLYVVAYISAGALLIERHPKIIELSLQLLLIAGSISLVISLYLYISVRAPNGMTVIGWLFRLDGYGILKNPIVAAQHYGVLCLIATYYSLNNKTLWIKYACIIIAIVSAIAVFWTRSRGPSLYLPFCLVLLFLFAQIDARKIAIKIFIGITSLSIALLCIFPNIKALLFNRSFSISRRMEIWKTLIQETLETPLFGVGARKFMDVSAIDTVYHHAHSSWVEIFYYGGIVALLLMSVAILISLVKTLKNKYTNIFIAWFIFGLLSLSTNGHYLLSKPGWQWILYWIPIAFIIAINHSKNNTIKNAEGAVPERVNHTSDT